jgi:hypothetical protein
VALRTGHGKGKGVPRIEVLPPDELPVGVAAPTRPAPVRDDSGRFLPSDGTSELARKGGLAAAESRQLAQLLGLWEPPEGHEYAPYARLAREWRDAHTKQLAATVGGGEVGPGPASIVATAALQLAAGRFLSDLGAKNGDPKMLLDGSRLGDSSRQSLLAAHELTAKEAHARADDEKLDLVTRQREFQKSLAARQTPQGGTDHE